MQWVTYVKNWLRTQRCSDTQAPMHHGSACRLSHDIVSNSDRAPRPACRSICCFLIARASGVDLLRAVKDPSQDPTLTHRCARHKHSFYNYFIQRVWPGLRSQAGSGGLGTHPASTWSPGHNPPH